MQSTQSDNLFETAKKYIPGGVNSPVRAFAAVEGNPPFIVSGKGAYMTDADGNTYIDLIGSWGPMIVGHAHPIVIDAMQKALMQGTSFGAPTEKEVQFAQMLCDSHPCVDMVRLCSSGTEATMHAIRLARGYTKRDVIVKIDGCFHGAHDSVLVEAGSGVATFAKPGSLGIPQTVSQLTKTAPFNDIETIKQHLIEGNIAAVILEAVPGNMGCIVPKERYLHELASLCKEHGTLLIVDEVMTGFRLAKGGACEYYKLEADIVTLGKIVGGGLPLAAFGGKREIMSCLSPMGAVYQAGTLSGNPLAVSAGIATLGLLTPEMYSSLEAKSAYIEEKLRPMVEEYSLSFTRVGSMFTIFFGSTEPQNFADVKNTCDFAKFGKFHRYMLEEGVYLPPSQYEAIFLSDALTQTDLDRIVSATKVCLAKIFA
jgi:glutamate-1-semialdehyde 2,1-aminomutase